MENEKYTKSEVNKRGYVIPVGVGLKVPRGAIKSYKGKEHTIEEKIDNVVIKLVGETHYEKVKSISYDYSRKWGESKDPEYTIDYDGKKKETIIRASEIESILAKEDDEVKEVWEKLNRLDRMF